MISISILIAWSILYILSDTITEFLSNGKSFTVNELKTFK
jgi:hypothetical protein